MSEIVEVKTADMTGQALDWATGVADGLDIVVMANFKKPGHRVLLATPFTVERPGHTTFHDKSYRNWLPSTDWGQGGPLIERHLISLHWLRSGYLANPAKLNAPTFRVWGSTALIAACRAIVTDKLGETVQVPKELMP